MDISCHVCPYLDNRDERCASHLTMLNIHEAFRLCVDNHECCSNYHQIRISQRYADRELAVSHAA